jgi:hypothetical protein
MNDRRSDRVWRRLAIAAPLSLFVHFLVLMLTRPEYRPVADVAVDLDVLEAAPGPPPTAPEPAPPEPEAAPVAPPPGEKIAIAPKVKPAEPTPTAPDAGVAAADRDGGPTAVAALEGDAGPGEGGICLHDLFPFAPDDPSWIAWVSMASFRGTEFESGFSRLLSTFTMYREMAGASGLDPGEDVEGFLVTADPFDDPRSYRVIATYDSGQRAVVRALTESAKGRAGFAMTETTAGTEASIPGAYRWHLVGNGRVLAVTSEPPAAASASEDSAAPDAGAAAPAAPSHPEWPRDVTCMVEAAPKKGRPNAPVPFGPLVRGLIAPDPGGHWPAMIIATRDPRAIGLSRAEALPAGFRWAYAAATFSDPMRLDGAVQLDGTAVEVAAVAAEWRAMIARAAADPFLALAGLDGVLDALVIEQDGTRVRFSLPLTGRQIQAALIMLEMQAEGVDRQILRKRAR